MLLHNALSLCHGSSLRLSVSMTIAIRNSDGSKSFLVVAMSDTITFLMHSQVM